MENYSLRLKEFFSDAQELAIKLSHQRLLPEHLLFAMIQDDAMKKLLIPPF